MNECLICGAERPTDEHYITEHTGRPNDYIGSSDAAMVADLSPYGSPLTVWNRLTGLVDDDREPSLRMWLGDKLEPIVLELYEGRTGLHPERVTIGHPGSTEPIRSKEHSFIGAHPDFDHLEVKTTVNGREWGEDESTVTLDHMAIPLHIYLQVQHQLYVMGWEVEDVAVLIGHDSFRRYVVPRNETIVSALVASEVELWRQVQEGVVPSKSDPEARKAYLRARFPRPTEPSRSATPEEAELVALWRDAKAVARSAKAAEDELSDRLRLAIGDSEGLAGLATYRMQTSRTVDTIALKAGAPGTYRKYLRERSFRVLRAKHEDEE
jgi:predicted phage-related endonuclease